MLMIYGSYGYTGELCVEEARRRGVPFVTAGRNAAKVERAFPVEQADLACVTVLLNCAGPFSRTATPLVDACLRARAHYVDITGEIDVFVALAARDAEARAAGVMLLPGAGYDVVPSDCLALHAKERLPTATRLRLAMQTRGGMSHGTATTAIEHLHRGGVARRGGKLVEVPMGEVRSFDFGRGPREAVSLPWGDVATAWYSTGIPDITCYAVFPPAARRAMRWLRWAAPALGTRPVQALLHRWVDARGPGPSPEARARGGCTIVAEAEDDAGGRVVSRLRTPEGYTLTARAAIEVCRRALAGDAPAGFQTPAKAYGSELVRALEGVGDWEEVG